MVNATVRLKSVEALKIICRSRSLLEAMYTTQLIKACLKLGTDQELNLVRFIRFFLWDFELGLHKIWASHSPVTIA